MSATGVLARDFLSKRMSVAVVSVQLHHPAMDSEVLLLGDPF